MESQILAGILGALAPMLISLLKRVSWTVGQKQLLAIVMAVVICFLASLTEAENYWTNWAINLPITLGAIEFTYAYIWERIKPLESLLRKSGNKDIGD